MSEWTADDTDLASIKADTLSVDFNQFETILVDYEGQTYEIVERDGGIALERTDA